MQLFLRQTSKVRIIDRADIKQKNVRKLKPKLWVVCTLKDNQYQNNKTNFMKLENRDRTMYTYISSFLMKEEFVKLNI